jgi:hypothetical protein
MKQKLLVLLSLVFLVAGCHPYGTLRPTTAAPTPKDECREVLARVDRLVAAAETTDTSVFPVTGFPFLRTNRFLADTARRPNGPQTSRAWLEGMHALDITARQKELTNLDKAQLGQLAEILGSGAQRDTLIAFVQACSRRLFQDAGADPALAAEVKEALSLPSEYRLWRRAVGLYPLMALPVAYVSAARFDTFRQWHAMPLEQHARLGQPMIYRPRRLAPEPRRDPRRLFANAATDTLGLPLLGPEAQRQLVTDLAPVIVQDTAGPYDRIGTLRWQDGLPKVAPDSPSVYYYLSHGRFDDQPCLQVNYVFWYSHRAGPDAPWFEKGRLDGLTVRISLDPSGRPVMLDIMNTCGCYHFFVPDHSRIRGFRNPLLGLDPVVPTWLPQAFPEKRLQLTVISGWHQVLNIAADRTPNLGIAYTLRPYEELEMLPDERGQRRSIFNRKGIVYGSGRIEPLIFFSMGIPDIGSMRQRGHHAVQLVGRAHFDDPLLFDKTFDYR